jgi:replicative superfamily II helicase
MARFFAVDLHASTSTSSDKCISKRRKIVYISPSKALCEERFEDWSNRLAAMNLGIEIAVSFFSSHIRQADKAYSYFSSLTS